MLFEQLIRLLLERLAVSEHRSIERCFCSTKDGLASQEPVFVQDAVIQAHDVGADVIRDKETFLLQQQSDVPRTVTGRVKHTQVWSYRKGLTVRQEFIDCE